MSEKKGLLEEVKESLDNLMEMLETNGLELNEDGDIVDKITKKLVWNNDGEDDE